MKNIFLVTFIAFYFSANAQIKVGDHIDIGDYYYLNSEDRFKPSNKCKYNSFAYLYSVPSSVYWGATCDGRPCRGKSKKVNRIETNAPNSCSGEKEEKIYFSGKMIQYKQKNGSTLNRAMATTAPRYIANNKLYSDGVMYKHDKYKMRFPYGSNIFREDGSIKIKTTEIPNGMLLFQHLDKKGNVTAQYHVKKGEHTNSPFLLNNGFPSINFFDRDDGSHYEGNQTIGTFIGQNSISQTGFLYSLPLNKGAGSMVFLEDLESKKSYWSIIVNDKITHLQEANPKEKPDLRIITNNYVTKNINYGSFFSLKNKNQNPSGYGFNYDRTDVNNEKIKGYKHNTEVGIYKNGKLNGLGYRSNLYVYVFKKSYGIPLSDKYREYKIEYGIFKDGILTQNGKTLNLSSDKGLNQDLFSPTFMPSAFKYNNYEVPKEIDIDEKKYRSLGSTNSYGRVLIKDMNRVFWIKKIDLDKNLIYIESDLDKKLIPIDITKRKVYYQNFLSGLSSCKSCHGRGTKKEQLYKDEEVNYSYTTGEMGMINPATGKWARGTTTYSATYNKRVKAGTKTITCNVCKGSGKGKMVTKGSIYVHLVP